MISDEASQGANGQIISENDDAVLKFVVQSGRSEQQHTPDTCTHTHTHTHR